MHLKLGQETDFKAVINKYKYETTVLFKRGMARNE
jgi:hypothetical protein